MDQKSNNKKPPPVSVRLTPEERAQLEEAAAGMTLSAYVRECLFDKNGSRRKHRLRYRPTADQEALAKVLGLLGRSRIANNLNQLAKSGNQGLLVWNEDAQRQAEEAYAHVQAMRDMLVRALGLLEDRNP